MRALVIAAVLLGLASSAAAQPAVLVKSKPIQGTAPAPLDDMPARTTVWIKEEAKRQAEAPTDLNTLEFEMLKVMSDDLDKVARRKKLSFDEMSVIVLQQVISRAASTLDRSVHQRRRALASEGAPEAADPQMQALLTRKAGLLALINELKPRMTANSRLLTSTK